jgi:hypothetical protein
VDAKMEEWMDAKMEANSSCLSFPYDRFSTEEEALAIANASHVGLAGELNIIVCTLLSCLKTPQTYNYYFNLTEPV